MAENDSKKNYSYLDQLSTEELEAILRASALSEEADDPDLVDHILEVIVPRQKEKNDVPDVEQARRDFDKYYRNLDEPLYPATDNETDLPKPNEPPLPVFRTKKRRIRYALIAAVVIVALVSLTCIPVFGYDNIVQMVAYWTADQFGFRPEKPATSESSDPTQVPEEFVELQAAMQQLGADLVIPKFPKEFEAGEPVLSYYPESNALNFSIIYQKESNYFIFGVNRDGDKNTNSYEKSEFLVKTSLYDGIKHYFLSNAENSTVAWYDKNNIEHYIVTNMPFSDLEEILKSMYEV